MGTLRPVDSYVADLITALRKAFEVVQNMTQMEAMRQKRRYDQKASTVTLNKGDVVLMRNDQFVGKRKLKDHWGDNTYTVCNQVDVDVLMYVIKNNWVSRPLVLTLKLVTGFETVSRCLTRVVLVCHQCCIVSL